MAFYLDLISRALDEAVSDAEEAYNRRKVEYAGYEKSGKVAAYADAMVEAQKARAEFTRLRKALDGAKYARASRTGTVRTPVGWCVPKMDYLLVEDSPRLPVEE